MRKTARLVLGLLFVFRYRKSCGSGRICVGVLEYFTAFGVGFLKPLSLVSGMVLSTVEFVLGVMVLLDFRKRAAAWECSFLCLFHTVDSLPGPFQSVEDCGCLEMQ